MTSLATLVPGEAGLNTTWKLELPPGWMVVAGNAVTMKSEAFAPVTFTTGAPLSSKAPDPLLVITKVLVIEPEQCCTDPKLVLLSGEVLLPRFKIAFPFPEASISGVPTVTL